MATQLDALISDLTKQVANLEREIQTQNSRLKEARAAADLEQVVADKKIKVIREKHNAEITELKAQQYPLKERQQQFAALESRLAEYKQEVQAEMSKLRAERGGLLAELTQNIASEQKRLDGIRAEIARHKAAIAAA